MIFTLDAEQKKRLARLFREFLQAELPTIHFQQQTAALQAAQLHAQQSYATLLDKAERNQEISQEITNDILLKLLPHADTRHNRARGAWLHIAPAVTGDLRTWYEAAGWTEPGDWPLIAHAILHLIQRAIATPDQLSAACQEFTALPQTKGFQSGTLSPILNALRPQEFFLLNQRSRATLNYFCGTSYRQTLSDYPAANATLHVLIAHLPELTRSAAQREMPSGDLFLLFSQWLAAVKHLPLRTSRYWAVTLREDAAWQWQEWHEGRYIALGWDELGDLSALSRRDFNELNASLAAQYPGWIQRQAQQAWNFARHLREGDRVLVRLDGDILLASATISGPYYVVHDLSPGHRLPVVWDDTTPRRIALPPGRDLVELDKATFESAIHAPATDWAATLESQAQPSAEAETIPPFVTLGGTLLRVMQVSGNAPQAISSTQIAERVRDSLPETLPAPLADDRRRFRRLYARARRFLVQLGLLESGDGGRIHLTAAGIDADPQPEMLAAAYHEWQYQRRRQATLADESETIRTLTESVTYDSPYPLPAQPAITLAEPQTPYEAAPDFHNRGSYTLTDLADESGLDETTLAGYLRAIERKGQAIFYGPPGSGKTFLARRLARHLAGNTGFAEIVQFHPAYSYEEFVQGIRPITIGGQLTYALAPGRFVDFCRRAAEHSGRCILVIDEINRADLARVFGELLYLLEYRNERIRLAGDTLFAIPANVRILGTMNSADRSIALVDYALRRRFALIGLFPDQNHYASLRRYHQRMATGFTTEPLIELLQRINQTIGDRHYALGIAYFLRPDLAAELPNIWQTEIEPYLEEHFFDRPDRASEFAWERVRSLFEI